MIGRSISHYRITGKLGAGGMGEVYLAHDTKLGRDVALKVLPEAFAKDAERMARFQREAEVLASLNHPNIAAIYGSEESSGVTALVMELVEGPTLAELLEKTKIGPSFDFRSSSFDPLPIAKQICEGLEYAHEKGVIHRDLKPANIKVTPGGAVKILDFGLAKALDTAVGGVSPPSDVGAQGLATLQNSPTLTAAATQAGVILGTAAYMSPEQARGKPVDRRADIWAFGCVLYEMLAGRRAFDGETATDVLASVVRAEPDFEALPAPPPSVLKLIRRCLAKDSRQRLRDIGEARIAIEDTLSGSVEAGLPRQLEGGGVKPPHQVWRQVLPWGLSAILALALVTLIIGRGLRGPAAPARPIARLSVTLSPSDRLALGLTPVLALSPDGSRLVFVANRSGAKQLYMRSLNSLEAKAIPGTEGAETPFFSPDGQSVAFFAEGKLKRVSLGGGAPLTLCSATANRGGSWGPDDSIIFTASYGYAGLLRVSAAGGTPKTLTTPDQKKGEISHRWPQILPGGKAVLLTDWAGGSFDDARIGVMSLETGERRTLIEGGTYGRYVPSGHLIYARTGGLLAVPLDLKRLQLTGSPVSILEGVVMHPTTGAAEFSSSDDGSLVYVGGGLKSDERTLLWVNRNGVAQAVAAPPRPYFSPRLSPDGKRVAVGTAGSNEGLWIYDLARGTLTQLVGTPILSFPIWTPDGKRLAFNQPQQGPWNLFWIPSDGSGSSERLATSPNAQFPGSWSPDGQMLALSELDPTTGYDVKVMRLSGDRKPESFLQTPSNESDPIFFPDGRFLAYQSDESGRWEIYVRPFPGPGGKWQISTEGGTEPVWGRSGRELFYRNGDKMMGVAVETKPAFIAARPRLLFEGQYEPGLYAASANYDVSPDGQRFLMMKSGEPESAIAQINVVLNWFEDLKGRVPMGNK